MPRKTMEEISYGIKEPKDLLDKLIFDGKKINEDPHPYDIFNFIITAASLNDWIKNYYKNSIVTIINQSLAKHDLSIMPQEVTKWITDKNCLPNQGCDVRRHIYNSLHICWGTANASKHFHWFKNSGVKSIDESPEINDWYKYFFTSTEPGLFIDINGEYYNLIQIKNIVIQFYLGLLGFVNEKNEHWSIYPNIYLLPLTVCERCFSMQCDFIYPYIYNTSL